MSEEIQKIFEEQVEKLPKEVVDFLSSANWDGDLDEIGSLYNLSPKELSDLHREATLVLAGLAHPDEFGDNLEKEAGIHGAVRDAIVTAVEQRIFAPVRSTLVGFLGEEEGAEVESVIRPRRESADSKSKVERREEETILEEVPPVPPVPNVPRAPRLSGVAPDNLPVAEPPEYLTPPLASKPANLDVGHPSNPSEHPFEEKMKRVFTAGQQSMGELTLEPVAPATPTPARLSHDPYREAIE